jgi:tetratricopeptide (TPR) repeat protein
VKRSDATRLGDDVQVAELLQKKGEAYLFKNEFVKAKATFDSAIQIQKRFSSMKDSLPLASFTCCLGMAYYYLNDFAHAKLLFQECIRIQLQVSGDDESCIVYSLCWLGRQHQSCNEPRKALELYLLALQRCKTIKSIDYRVVVQLLHAIGEVCENESINQLDMSLKCKCSRSIALIVLFFIAL